MALRSFLLCLTLHTILAAAGLTKRFEEYSVHEERSALPHAWTKRSDIPLDKSRRIPIRINLVQNGIDEYGEELLMKVSHPHSPHYGKHYSPHEVADLFAPKKEAIDTVLEWLREAGLEVSRAKHYNHWKGAIVIDIPISMAEELFNTTYDNYEHGPSGANHVACMKYSVPKAVKHHVDFVLPSVHFDVPHENAAVIRYESGHFKRNAHYKRNDSDSVPQPGHHNSPIDPKVGKKVTPLAGPSAQGSLDTCNQQITLACLTALYGIKYTQKATKKNSFGIVEYTPQSYVPSDMDLFFQKYAANQVGTRPNLVSIDGGVPGGTDFGLNIESNLDLQYGMGLTYPLKTTLYQVGDNIVGGSFNTFLDALDASYCHGDDPNFDPQYPDTQPGGYNKAEDCGKYKATKVISTSYAYNEADLTPAYEKRQCNEYLKLGMMGVTVVYASGDYGVAGNGGACLDNGGRFNPSFPSVCPYITSIGATQVSPNKTVNDPEEAANNVIFSGGGFSNNFKLPLYQAQVVHNWWNKFRGIYSSSQMNTTEKTRAFPDISANGVNYVVAIDGSFWLVYGTSASTPVVGAMFALINDARLAKGKKSIGFVNPVLYKNPKAFHDITVGNNPGCGTNGFAATKGWDPVTGLGTPDFQKLLKVFTSLP